VFRQGMQATGVLEIHVVREGRSTGKLKSPDFRVDAPGVEGYVFGRSDSTSSYEPDIDLFEHGAQDMGVSRRHAVLLRHRGIIHIMDLDSVNGTFVNGKRLSPNVPYVFNIGDKVSLANLEVTISQTNE